MPKKDKSDESDDGDASMKSTESLNVESNPTSNSLLTKMLSTILESYPIFYTDFGDFEQIKNMKQKALKEIQEILEKEYKTKETLKNIENAIRELQIAVEKESLRKKTNVNNLRMAEKRFYSYANDYVQNIYNEIIKYAATFCDSPDDNDSENGADLESQINEETLKIQKYLKDTHNIDILEESIVFLVKNIQKSLKSKNGRKLNDLEKRFLKSSKEPPEDVFNIVLLKYPASCEFRCNTNRAARAKAILDLQRELLVDHNLELSTAEILGKITNLRNKFVKSRTRKLGSKYLKLKCLFDDERPRITHKGYDGFVEKLVSVLADFPLFYLNLGKFPELDELKREPLKIIQKKLMKSCEHKKTIEQVEQQIEKLYGRIEKNPENKEHRLQKADNQFRQITQEYSDNVMRAFAPHSKLFYARHKSSENIDKVCLTIQKTLKDGYGIDLPVEGLKNACEAIKRVIRKKVRHGEPLTELEKSVHYHYDVVFSNEDFIKIVCDFPILLSEGITAAEKDEAYKSIQKLISDRFQHDISVDDIIIKFTENYQKLTTKVQNLQKEFSKTDLDFYKFIYKKSPIKKPKPAQNNGSMADKDIGKGNAPLKKDKPKQSTGLLEGEDIEIEVEPDIDNQNFHSFLYDRLFGEENDDDGGNLDEMEDFKDPAYYDHYDSIVLQEEEMECDDDDVHDMELCRESRESKDSDSEKAPTPIKSDKNPTPDTTVEPEFKKELTGDVTIPIPSIERQLSISLSKTVQKIGNTTITRCATAKEPELVGIICPMAVIPRNSLQKSETSLRPRKSVQILTSSGQKIRKSDKKANDFSKYINNKYPVVKLKRFNLEKLAANQKKRISQNMHSTPLVTQRRTRRPAAMDLSVMPENDISTIKKDTNDSIVLDSSSDDEAMEQLERRLLEDQIKAEKCIKRISRKR